MALQKTEIEAESYCLRVTALAKMVLLQGVYFATVSMHKQFAEVGPDEGNLANRLESYQELVTEYNDAIEETIEEKGH